VTSHKLLCLFEGWFRMLEVTTLCLCPVCLLSHMHDSRTSYGVCSAHGFRDLAVSICV
jgi:hypothetical protein